MLIDFLAVSSPRSLAVGLVFAHRPIALKFYSRSSTLVKLFFGCISSRTLTAHNEAQNLKSPPAGRILRRHRPTRNVPQASCRARRPSTSRTVRRSAYRCFFDRRPSPEGQVVRLFSSWKRALIEAVQAFKISQLMYQHFLPKLWIFMCFSETPPRRHFCGCVYSIRQRSTKQAANKLAPHTRKAARHPYQRSSVRTHGLLFSLLDSLLSYYIRVFHVLGLKTACKPL